MRRYPTHPPTPPRRQAGQALTAYVLELGHALGATSDANALDRVAHIAGVSTTTLTHALAWGTLAALPTGAVRAILTAAKLVPGSRHAVTIDDLAPLDAAPLHVLITAVKAQGAVP